MKIDFQDSPPRTIAHCYTFSSLPTIQTLSSGSQEHKILLWNLQTGKHRSTISNISGRVHTLVFSPDGKKLVSSSSEEGTIEIWRSP